MIKYFYHKCNKIPKDVEIIKTSETKSWKVCQRNNCYFCGQVTGGEIYNIKFCPFCGEELK